MTEIRETASEFDEIEREIAGWIKLGRFSGRSRDDMEERQVSSARLTEQGVERLAGVCRLRLAKSRKRNLLCSRNKRDSLRDDGRTGHGSRVGVSVYSSGSIRRRFGIGSVARGRKGSRGTGEEEGRGGWRELAVRAG